jgi:hypothetical protein
MATLDKAMGAKFKVSRSFALPDRRTFVLAGSVVEGEVRAGMFVHIPLNSELTVVVPIDAVEYASRAKSEEVRLCLNYADPEDLEIWKGLNLGGQVLQVAKEANRSATGAKSSP